MKSHNISANQIRLDAEARRRAAEQGQDGRPAQEGGQINLSTAIPADVDQQEEEEVVAQPGRRTRASAADAREEKRKKEQKAIDKIKASKKSRKRKKKGDSDDDDDEDELARAIFQERSVPLPGQMENCAKCGKRFTVTPYSRNAPDGGLVCNPCGKELAKEDGVPKKKPKRIGGGISGRRQVQSKILDGTFYPGAKNLMTLCIETLAKNIDLAEDLGELSELVIDKIARKLSKHRLLDPRTLSLFLQPTAEQVYIYDCAKLTSNDFIRIFQTVPNLKKLKACNAIHFEDEVMDYLISRRIELEEFYLHGANLLSESKWNEFLEVKGKSLRSLKVYWTDKHFNDASVAALEFACPSLERLKIAHNERVAGEGIKSIAKIKNLRHLSLDLRQHIHSDVFVGLLNDIGVSLETFSLARVADIDNTVLDALHNKCRSLRKLRITESEVMTDDGFVRLFKGWKNRELIFVDLQKCRQVDAAHPRQNPHNIGLCSQGFSALMEHSGRTLEHVNVHGCRNITAAAFESVFSPGKTYPELKTLEISFCEEVTDFIVGSIFRSCPNLRELNVFGCMKVKDVKVPRGKLLVGVPNALGMVIDGNDE